jgi:hypothetical protein
MEPGWGGKYEMAAIRMWLASFGLITIKAGYWKVALSDGDGAGGPDHPAQCVPDSSAMTGLGKEQVTDWFERSLAAQDICWLGRRACRRSYRPCRQSCAFVAPGGLQFPQADDQ